MRLFSYLFILGLMFSTTNSHAQSAYAGAYAGASMMPGSGQWGGMQACPYVTNMSGTGCSSGNCAGLSKMDQLQAQIDKLDEEISDFEDEQSDLKDGSHDKLGDDKLPFKKGVAQGLAVIEAKRARRDDMPTCDFNNKVDPDMADLVGLIQTDPNQGDYCIDQGGGSIVLSSNRICNSGFIYKENSGKNSFEKNKKNCDRFLDRYFKLEGRIAQAEKKRDKLDDQLTKLQDKEDDRQYKAWDSGKPLAPEGAFCYACAVGRPEPQAPGWQSIVAAGTMDLLNAGIWYAGTRYVSRNNAKLGWATPPLAMGLPGANATASLFANAYGGGYGGGSFGCSPGAGYQWGPNGGYGNPYGAMSPYGMCGGAFGAPCGGPGFNVGMGGGIYAPGVGPGGMAGPWGGGGYYPNPYAMGGINMGGGFGMGGMGAMAGMGGPGIYPGIGGGFGGGLGIGGYGMNPYGILGNGFNPGAGYFPGVYPGGYGMQGGGLFGPMGGGYGYGPGGGMPGMGSPFGMGGPMGYNPYGGFGGPFGGIGGGMGLGGGFGSPFGMGMGGLGGADYQMQMLNMQMQQYQAAFQAQQRAYQNTQAVTQQIYGLQSEYQQIQQRYQYLMMQLYSGGGIGGGLGIGGGIGGGIGYGGGTGGMGSPGSGPIPILNGGGTGTVPTR